VEVEIKIIAGENVTWRVDGLCVDVVDAMHVEGGRLIAVEDVRKAGRIREAEDAVPDRDLLAAVEQPKTDGATYEGSKRGAHTMAILSGNMTWYPACVCMSRELRKQVCVGCV
jgi:hypothetical protein